MKVSKFSTAVAGTVFCLSGSALTILNKHIMVFLPAPNSVLLLQNVGTIILLFVGATALPYSIDPLERGKAMKWLPLVFLFYGMLVSSMLALENVTATTLIVQRNLATVSIAIADYIFLGTKQSKKRIAAIVCMCFGAFMYAHSDLRDARFSFVGYFWLGVNVATTTAYQIKVKSLVNQLELNSWNMSYYNNFLSLPFCMVFAALYGEFDVVKTFLIDVDTVKASATFLSCTLGFLLSVSAFQLNRMISPTSITVLNNANKFVLIFFTAYFMDFQSLTGLSVAGMLFVMTAAAAYSLVRAG